MAAKNGTECVLCGAPGVTVRYVAKVGYQAWVCRRHAKKD